MRVLICPDKFKYSLPATAVCEHIATGIHQARPDILTVRLPLADGGEGTLEVISKYLPQAQRIDLHSTDPLGRPVAAYYYIASGKAYIEMALASGLTLLSPKEQSPGHVSSEGTGSIIADAIRRSVDEVYVFVGGSATHDAGMGLAHALGVRFLDQKGNPLTPIGAHLGLVSEIIIPSFFESMPTLHFLTDVTNPITGPQGAARTYAPQKGAGPEEINRLEQGTQSFLKVLSRYTSREFRSIPGLGAAGGAPATLAALANAKVSGAWQMINRLTLLEDRIAEADLLITGEGKLDGQSLHGKTVSGVLKLARKRQKPVHLFVGESTLNAGDLKNYSVQSILEVSEYAGDLADALHNAGSYLEQMARDLFSK